MQRTFDSLGDSLTTVDWKKQTLKTFARNFYKVSRSTLLTSLQEHANVTKRSEEDIRAFRGEHKMSVKGETIPRPVTSFEEAGFPKYIASTLSMQKFEKPTCIQSQGWPIALSGRDMVGIAETGSGKTLAFILPAIVHVQA